MKDYKPEVEYLVADNIVPMCYGCKYYLGSSCSHPESIKVKWDNLRKFTYHYPSVLMCSLHLKGRCSLYIPHENRGADYTSYKENILTKAGPSLLNLKGGE